MDKEMQLKMLKLSAHTISNKEELKDALLLEAKAHFDLHYWEPISLGVVSRKYSSKAKKLNTTVRDALEELLEEECVEIRRLPNSIVFWRSEDIESVKAKALAQGNDELESQLLQRAAGHKQKEK